MEREKYSAQRIGWEKGAVALVWAMHFFGLLGSFWSPMMEMLNRYTPFSSFIDLTPLNLVVTAAVLLMAHSEWSRRQVHWCVLAFAAGYGIEVLGVHSGLVFGEYSYGEVLGWKLLEVPLSIGLNWMVLTYVSGILLIRLKAGAVAKAMLMATLLVSLDVLIEPVAIHWGFWSWGGGEIPLQNYVAWWVIAFLLSFLWQKAFSPVENKLAKHIWWAQVFFFLGNNLLIYT